MRDAHGAGRAADGLAAAAGRGGVASSDDCAVGGAVGGAARGVASSGVVPVPHHAVTDSLGAAVGTAGQAVTESVGAAVGA